MRIIPDTTFPEGNFQTPYEYIIYDGVKQIMTLDDNKEPIGKYVWQPPSSGDADVILWDESGVYSTDLNKNVTGYHTIPGESGQPGSTYFDYTPFGEPLNGSRRFGFSSEERFTGTQYIQTNLILYLYRAYSPALKRWLTRDPIAEQGGVNLYNFVGNNPVTRWDEFGAAIITLVIITALGAVTGTGASIALYGDFDMQKFTPEEQRILDEYLDILFTCAIVYGKDPRLGENLRKMQILGRFKDGYPKDFPHGTSETRANIFGIRNRTLLAGKFFTEFKPEEKFTTLLHESYHAGTNDYMDDGRNLAYKYAEKAFEDLKCCLMELLNGQDKN